MKKNIIKISCSILLLLLVMPLISAWEWDNIGVYNEQTKTVDIKNALNFPVIGDSIAEVQLIRNTEKCVYHCSAVMKLTLKKDYENPLSELVFENIQGEEISIENYEINFIEYENYEVEVNDYGKDICYQLINGTQKCSKNIIGTHKETKTREVKIDKYDYKNKVLSAGTYYIRIDGVKSAKQSIDWIPNYAGVEIKEWAWWLGTAPDMYYKLNEAEGGFYNATDEIGVRNLSQYLSDGNNRNVVYREGKLNNGALFNSSESGYIGLKNQTSSDDYDLAGNFTIAFWLNITEEPVGYDMIMGGGDGPNWGEFSDGWTFKDRMSGSDLLVELHTRSNYLLTIDGKLNLGEWYRIVIVREGVGAGETKMYVNGELNNTGTIPSILDNSYFGLGYGAGYSENQQPFQAGMLDDVAIYKGITWDLTDVEYDWNSGDGLELDSLPISVIQSYPDDLYNETTTLTMNFQCNSTISGDTFGQSTLRIYDIEGNLESYQSKDITGTANATNYSFDFPNSDTYFWSCQVNNSDGTSSDYTGNRTLYMNRKTFGVNSVLDFPEDAIVISDSDLLFGANFSANEGNISNATLYVWNSDDSLFGINTSIVTGMTNTSNMSISGLTMGNYLWNVFVCGENITDYLCEFALSNYSFKVAGILTSVDYNPNTFETKNETFKASYNILEGAEISLAQLIYNGTNYTISDITKTDTTFNVSKVIDIPLNINPFENETREFYFRFKYEGDIVQVTDNYTQNVSFINLQLCNDTYNTTSVNFTYYDELTNEQINATTNRTSIKSTFHYWLGGGDIYKNYSYNNLSNNLTNQYKFCIFPADKTIITDMDLEYEAADYSSRTYYFRDASLTNVTNEILLNLLTSNNAVKFFISVRNGLNPFTEAVITISKYFIGEGIYRTISVRESDEDGEFIEYLDLDEKYRFDIVKEGESYGSLIKQASCDEAPCRFTLQVESAETDAWQGYYDVFAKDVATTLKYDDTEQMVTYDFNDLTGLAHYFVLTVSKTAYNQTGENICNNTLYSTSGSLTCNMSGQIGDFKATGYISRSPPKITNYITFVISSLKNIFGQTGLFISLLLIITIAFVGSWNPAVGVTLGAFAILMMKILGFAAMNYATVIIVFIIAIILIIKMKT